MTDQQPPYDYPVERNRRHDDEQAKKRAYTWNVVFFLGGVFVGWGLFR